MNTVALIRPDAKREPLPFLAVGISCLKAYLPVHTLVLLLPLIWAATGNGSWQVPVWIAAYALFCIGLTMLGIRRGLGRRWGDPGLLTLQIWLNLGLVALSYALVPSARSVALQVMCLVLASQRTGLTARQSRLVSLWGALLLLASVAWLERFHIQSRSLDQELIYAMVAALMVPAILLVAENGRRLHAHQMQLHACLQQTLVRLEALSRIDSLTKLCNRRRIQQLLEEEVQRSSRSNRTFAMSIIDIDHFKRINDQFGHAVGDEVLVAFGSLLRRAFPEPLAHAGRWGGEEFLVVLPEAGVADLAARMRWLQLAVRQQDWSGIAAGLTVTFSAGVDAPVAGKALARCLAEVDEALYKAKALGRDQVAFVQPQTASDGIDRIWRPSDEMKDLQLAPPESTREREHVSLEAGVGTSNHWLLGVDDHMQHKLRLTLVPALLYGFWLLLVWLWGVEKGLLSPSMAKLLSAAMLLGATVPYALIRSGMTRHWRDPLLILPQILYGSVLTVLAYVCIPMPRALLLQLLCHMVIFGALGVRPRGSIAVGISMSTMLLGAGAYLLYTDPGFTVLIDGLSILAACVVQGLLSRVSYSHAQARQRIEQERRELEEATAAVLQLTSTDSLTGLPNRDAVLDAAMQECRRQDELANVFSVALIDLDHFKQVNDRFGHPVGDEVLVAFAAIARDSLRAIDVIGRWGGEEFLVLLPETMAIEDGLQPLERLRAALEGAHVSAAIPTLRVTMSAGLVLRSPHEPLEAVIQRADRTLYEAKKRGRNRIEIDA